MAMPIGRDWKRKNREKDMTYERVVPAAKREGKGVCAGSSKDAAGLLQAWALTLCASTSLPAIAIESNSVTLLSCYPLDWMEFQSCRVDSRGWPMSILPVTNAKGSLVIVRG